MTARRGRSGRRETTDSEETQNITEGTVTPDEEEVDEAAANHAHRNNNNNNNGTVMHFPAFVGASVPINRSYHMMMKQPSPQLQQQHHNNNNNNNNPEEMEISFVGSKNGGNSIHTHTNSSTKTPQLPWPTRLLQRWTYSYMDGIFRQGKSQFQQNNHLTLQNLYAVPEAMQASALVHEFWSGYKSDAHPTLLRTLWKIASRYYLPSAIWELLYIGARVSLPLAVRELLLIVQDQEDGVFDSDNTDNNDDMWRRALPHCLWLAGAGLLGALAQGRSVFLATQAAIAVRAALTSLIYQHSLQLTPAGCQGLTAGQVTNLVAIDTQKLYDVIVEGQNLWSCPVLVVIVSFLLWRSLGPQMVAGVAILILFLPFIKWIVSTMLQIRKERSLLTDRRIQLITSMLQGIRVTKLNHYEQMVEQAVMAVRKLEMKLLSRELRFWGLVLTTAVSSPILAFGGAIALYVLLSNDNGSDNPTIRPSDAFSALLLFSILRFPINLAARIVGKAAQAIESVRRIDEFLQRDVRPTSDAAGPHSRSNDDDYYDMDDGAVLQIRDGHFVVESRDALLDPTVSSSNNKKAARKGGKPKKSSKKDMDRSSKSQDTGDDNDDHTNTEMESSPLTSTSFAVRDISLTVRPGQLVAVVGRVGSGKTLLLRALLGELPSETPVCVRGTVSYGSQEPFILNATVRDNILFGSAYDASRYETAIRVTALEPDLARLGPAGDWTQIGERGVTLSGGQKQRVALARAVYANPSVALLDDCFSALDPQTAKVVFEGLFHRETGALRDQGTVLVTHALHFLPRADLILVMEGGKPSFMGTYQELQQLEEMGQPERRLGILGAAATHEADSGEPDGDDSAAAPAELHRQDVTEKDGVIMTVEEREYGIAGAHIWLEWVKHAGGWPFAIGQIIWLLLDRGLYVISDWWIAMWTESHDEGRVVFGMQLPAQSEGRSAQSFYVMVYIAIIFLSIVATLFRSLWAVAGGARCARGMFKLMATRILRAPMSFFETTPMGRIVNRFTYDVEVMDIELSVSMTGLMMSSSWLLSSVIVVLSVLPWTIFAMVPVGIIYFYVQLYYRMSGPDLQRLDAVSRTPIQACLAEGLEGATIIRAYNKEETFAAVFRKKVDANSSAMLNHLAAQRWLGLRIEVLGLTIVNVCSLSVVFGNQFLEIPAGLVGMLILWAIIFTAALNFFFLRLTDSEARLTSIERIHQTSLLPQEAAWQTAPSVQLDPAWPRRGDLEFDRVCLRYRDDLPLALDEVSFRIPPGSRCGVVGRTGAGKTSLTASLFRMVELESGQIRLDGVDLAQLGLADVRGRTQGLRVIPQDPVLYAGTLRDCLDPFQQCSDDTVLVQALCAVQHEGARERGRAALADGIDEGGSNLSVGERQLLCLARAIVEEPRVLVLDEATASVDSSTDGLIQEMLRSRFEQTTLLTIAHRLGTIMDYDYILVMDDGKVAQYGRPSDLLEDEAGIFVSLVNSTGTDKAAELRAIAAASTAERRKKSQ